MDIAVTPTLPFVISVMPFEKQLIAEAIVVHGSALEFPETPLYRHRRALPHFQAVQ